VTNINSASRGLLGRPLHLRSTLARSYATQLPSNPSAKPLIMPHDMPREDYASPAMYTLSYMSRIVRYVVVSGVSLSLLAYAGFEGSHWYIEHVTLSAPSRDGGDEYGWQEETQGWTGGASGGTDSRLGWKARHALRGAWLCQERGAGATPGSIGSSLHGDANAAKGLIGAGAVNVNKVDRGYELADEYIDVAIKQAVKKNLTFPASLSVTRLPGPPREDDVAGGVPRADPTAVDLLLLKAGILERISTSESRSRAQDLYETVLVDAYRTGGDRAQAKVIRLATKVGDLSARRGDVVGAKEWWTWGLARAGISLASEPTAKVVAPVQKGWFGAAKPAVASAPGSPAIRAPVTAPETLSPAALRATTSLLVSLAAHHATSSSLSAAQSLQSLALSLLPTSFSSPDSTPSAKLHYTWLQSRRSLLSLHLASVLYAQDRVGSRGAALELLETAVDASEAILEHPPSASLPATKLLLSDTAKTAAEAHYTRAIVLERSADAEKDKEVLEGVLESLERAQSLVSTEGEGEGRGVEWQKYFKAAVRVRSKLASGSTQP
jgi:hypothetical protein